MCPGHMADRHRVAVTTFRGVPPAESVDDQEVADYSGDADGEDGGADGVVGVVGHVHGGERVGGPRCHRHLEDKRDNSPELDNFDCMKFGGHVYHRSTHKKVSRSHAPKRQMVPFCFESATSKGPSKTNKTSRFYPTAIQLEPSQTQRIDTTKLQRTLVFNILS